LIVECRDLGPPRFFERLAYLHRNRDVDIGAIHFDAKMIGQEVRMPVALAPVGLTGLNWADGEILAARAAERFGVPFTLSTMSICSIEDVRSVLKEPFWFQLYMFRDRGFSRSVIDRARAANCSALFVTVDLPMRGQRHADIKNGLTVPPRLTARNAWDIATKPVWLANVLLGRRKTFGNVEAYLKGRVGIEKAGAWSNQNFDRSLNWRDIEWVRGLWPGKLVLKGILDVEDARTAAKTGATVGRVIGFPRGMAPKYFVTHALAWAGSKSPTMARNALLGA